MHSVGVICKAIWLLVGELSKHVPLTCSNWKSAQLAKKCKGINVLVECVNGFSERCLFMKLSVAVTCFNFYFSFLFTIDKYYFIKSGQLRNIVSWLFSWRVAPNENPDCI